MPNSLKSPLNYTKNSADQLPPPRPFFQILYRPVISSNVGLHSQTQHTIFYLLTSPTACHTMTATHPPPPSPSHNKLSMIEKQYKEICLRKILYFTVVLRSSANDEDNYGGCGLTRQTQNMCITFTQCCTNVEENVI